MFERFKESDDEEETGLGGWNLVASILVPVLFVLLVGAMIYIYRNWSTLKDFQELKKFKEASQANANTNIINIGPLKDFMEQNKINFCDNCQVNWSIMQKLMEAKPLLKVNANAIQ